VANQTQVPYPTKEDWGKIHAKAWKDPQFRQLLETNPTEAVKKYGNEVGKAFDKIVAVDPPPNPGDVPEELWPLLHQAPPACC
jgi:hypothetical protein